MKNSLKYFGLWQKKRSELRIGDDPQTDWQQMQALLDQHLPIEEGKPSRAKGFKLMSVLFVSMSAAAMTYIVSNVIEIKKHKHNHTFGYHHKNNKVVPGIYSISNDSTNNLLVYNPPTGNKDNPGASKSSAAPQSADMANPAITKNPAIVATKSAGVSNGSRSVSKANSKPFSATNKNSGPKFSGTRSRHGGNGPMHGNRNNNSSPLAVNSNRPGNHTIINAANKQDIGKGKSAGEIYKANVQQYPVLLSLAPIPAVNQSAYAIYPEPITASNNNFATKTIATGILQRSRAGKSGKPGKSQKTKNTANKNSTPSNIDWGLLTGINTSGSFTPKSQNSNFYGSSPVDLYFGLYGTYNLNDNWAINTQLRLFSPQTISTTYNHANGSKVDSGQLVQVVNSAKFYSISVPIRAMYKVNNNISLVGGPVINIPVKMLNIKSSLLPAGIKADSTYYNKTISLLSSTKYQQSLNLGITAGINFQFKRLSIEASWLRSLSGYQVTSGYGSGTSYNNTVQFTIGFRLNKAGPKIK